MLIQKKRIARILTTIPTWGLVFLASSALYAPNRVAAQTLPHAMPKGIKIENISAIQTLGKIYNTPYEELVNTNNKGNTYVEFSDEPEDLVLAIYADNEKLSSGIFAIQKNNQYYLPVMEMINVLGFFGEFDSSRRSIEGWALSEEDRFSIDVGNKKLRYHGEETVIPSDTVLDADIANDDLYVAIEVLEEIWPVRFDVNLGALILEISADRMLPFQMKANREALRKRSEQAQVQESQEAEENFPFVPMPYKAFTKPSFDISTQLGYEAGDDSAIANVAISGVNDLAYASADYSINYARRGDENIKPENFRLRFRRQNIHEGALPWGLEDVQFGDVRLQNRDLIETNEGGRGLIFSTERDNKTGTFDQITLDGIGTPGWEAELYLNNELIEFGVVDERGEYRFEDIPIGFGNNRFKVVLYGPQGQIRERVENYVYQSSMLKKGDIAFSGGVVDSQNDLIPIEERRKTKPDGVTGNVYASYGLLERLTTFVTGNIIRDKEGADNVQREYVSAGVVGSVGTTIAQLEAYKQIDGGEAYDVRTISDFLGFKLNTQISAYQDFISPNSKTGGNPKELETEVTVKRIFDTLLGALGMELRHAMTKREFGPTLTNIGTRQSIGKSGLRLTNTTTTNMTDSDHTNSIGRISATTRYDDWSWRNSLNYDIYPDADVSFLQTDLRYGRTQEYSYGAFANYNLDTQEKRLGLQVSRDFDKFLGSVESDWSSKGGFGIMFRASTSLGPYGMDDDYMMKSKTFSSIAPVSSTIYRDNNYDGLFNDGDDPLPDIKLDIGRRAAKEKTDEHGYLLELTPAAGNIVNVKPNSYSIKDPYLVATTPGYKIFPRPGVKHHLDFALIEMGAIDGTLTWDAQGEPISGIRLQILNEEGDVIQETKTANDGYFTFEKIPPGAYTIRSNPEEGVDIPFKYVTLTPEELFQFGVDIVAISGDPVEDIDLELKLEGDGTFKIRDIIDLAKGFKDKKKSGKAKVTPAQDKSASADAVYEFVSADKAVVKAIRIGEYPDKVRIVMDMTAQTNYTVNFDEASNTITVDMPYVDWKAQDKWQSKGTNILHNYMVEPHGEGAKLILGVEDNVIIGKKGALSASEDKDDRIFIDIEKR